MSGEELVKTLEGFPQLQVQMTAAQWALVVAQIQLALRHPRNRNTAAAKFVENFARSVIAQMPAAVRAEMEKGFNPEFDTIERSE